MFTIPDPAFTITGIRTLLRAGYAPGADARWRTLHETAVTATFIAQHGKDVAERYLLHKEIRALAEAHEYQDNCRALGSRPYSQKHMDQLKAVAQSLVARYGKGFTGLYGWAADALGKPNDTHLGFKQIEAATQFDHWRPLYQRASHATHANAKAITFSLSLYPGQELLLVGPSNLGLASPGHSTAISLMHLTNTLVHTQTTVDSLLMLHLNQLVVRDIGRAFSAAHKVVKARRRKRKGSRTGGFFRTITTSSDPEPQTS